MPHIDPRPAVQSLLDLAAEHRAEADRLDEIVDTFCTCDDEEGGWAEVGFTEDGPAPGSVFVAPTDPAPLPVDFTPLLGTRLPFTFGPTSADALAAYEKPWRDEIARRYEQLREAIDPAFERLIERASVVTGLDGDRPAADFDEEEDASRVIDVEPGLIPATSPERLAEIRDFAARTGVTVPVDDYVPALPSWEYGNVMLLGTPPVEKARRDPATGVVEYEDSAFGSRVSKWVRAELESTIASFVPNGPIWEYGSVQVAGRPWGARRAVQTGEIQTLTANGAFWQTYGDVGNLEEDDVFTPFPSAR